MVLCGKSPKIVATMREKNRSVAHADYSNKIRVISEGKLGDSNDDNYVPEMRGYLEARETKGKCGGGGGGEGYGRANDQGPGKGDVILIETRPSTSSSES